MKTTHRRSGVVEDIWMNTMETPEDVGRITPTGPGRPASRDEIEEDTILVNPDVSSMEDRG